MFSLFSNISISAITDNIKEVLVNVVKQVNVTKARKLGYYNAFVRLCHRSGGDIDYGMSTEELLCW